MNLQCENVITTKLMRRKMVQDWDDLFIVKVYLVAMEAKYGNI